MSVQLDIEGAVTPQRVLKSYPGGKGAAGVYQTIINHMPPHSVYIEPFVGGGSILRHKRPARSTIVIDSDASAIQMLKARPVLDGLPVRYLVQCGIRFLQEFQVSADTVVYCDPPYLKHTRSSQRDMYKHEWETPDHIAFIAAAKAQPCMVMISGYESELYNALLINWHKITFTGQTRRGPRTECLWMNFEPPTALHDYQYLGEDYRERERIKRKAKRWEKRFKDLPKLEKQAILSLLLETHL